MFFNCTKFSGSACFRQAFDDLSIPSERKKTEVCKWLDVSISTLNDWLSGRREPPRSACIALWHESATGRAYIRTTYQNHDALIYGMALNTKNELEKYQREIDELRSEVARLERCQLVRAANDSDVCTFSSYDAYKSAQHLETVINYTEPQARLFA